MKACLSFGIRFFAFGLVCISLQAAGLETNSPVNLNTVPGGDMLETSIRMFGWLIFILSLFLAGAWYFKKTKFYSVYQGRTNHLKVLESKAIGHRNSIVVVGYSEQRFLVGVSNTGIQLLTRLPDAPVETSTTEPGHKSFAEHLNAFEQRKA